MKTFNSDHKRNLCTAFKCADDVWLVSDRIHLIGVILSLEVIEMCRVVFVSFWSNRIIQMSCYAAFHSWAHSTERRARGTQIPTSLQTVLFELLSQVASRSKSACALGTGSERVRAQKILLSMCPKQPLDRSTKRRNSLGARWEHCRKTLNDRKQPLSKKRNPTE